MDTLSRRRWHNMLVAAFADGAVETEEKAYLEQMRRELGLSAAEANEIVADYKASKGSLEFGGSPEERLELFRDILRVFWADGILQPKEKKAIKAIARHLKMEDNALDALVEECRPGAPDAADPDELLQAETEHEHPASEIPAMRQHVSPAPPPSALVTSADAIIWIDIPKGTFIFGDMSVGIQDERKRHDAFQISRDPITNAQWTAFVAATGHTGKVEYGEHFSDPDQPVVGVSFVDAEAYCAWAGGCLPSEVQWERAARGTDARKFPWGDTFASDSLAHFGRNLMDETQAHPAPVGGRPTGASPDGCQDMSGNVEEWCRPSREVREGEATVRGGHYLSAPYALNVYYSNCRPQTDRAPMLGFRIVRNCK